MKTLRPPLFTGICALLALTLVSLILGAQIHPREGTLFVAYLDVGQGDATLIQTPDGMQVLIDGGRNNTVLRGLTKYLGYFDRDIDIVIITHPDLDHIGGLIDVFKKYEIKTVLMTENVSETPAYKLLKRELEAENAELLFARRGQVFDLGVGPHGTTTLAVLFPDRDPTHLESNTSSIVARLVYGEHEFIFSGDSPSTIEEYLVSVDGAALRSDVLKIGHHGSKTSTAETYLSAVSPALAVISAGKDNRYGHPHPEVTGRLDERGIPYKNTADSGSVVVISDGKRIWTR